MGLDMYAYVSTEANSSWEETGKQREIAYWRKHPNLHGWMERLWNEKGRPCVEDHSSNADVMFNGIELELTWEDLERLEQDITAGELPYTEGFFFGSPADDYYLQEDLQFIKNARAEIFTGLRVFYNSSW